MCVLIHTGGGSGDGAAVLRLCVSAYCYICGRPDTSIYIHMCLHTAIYVCPHTSLCIQAASRGLGWQF
jgi:hypothetical protein